jgi:zinc finger CCHC domain-containing protein 8
MFVETVDPGEGDLSLAIFGDDEVEMLDVSASPVRKVPRCEETEREQDPRECPVIQLDQAKRVESGQSHRWATYPPTYFSSDLLPVYNGMCLPPIQPMTSSTFSSERHLLWERILHDADTESTQTQRLVSQYIGKVPQHSSLSAPLPIAPPPPLPPLPPPAPTTNLEVGAHQAGMSEDGESDGESDMEMSDSDS